LANYLRDEKLIHREALDTRNRREAEQRKLPPMVGTQAFGDQAQDEAAARQRIQDQRRQEAEAGLQGVRDDLARRAQLQQNMPRGMDLGQCGGK
jgi:hypothetical protein